MDESTLVKKAEQRLLNDEDLTVMTQKAMDDERQRVERIQQRQSQLPTLSAPSISSPIDNKPVHAQQSTLADTKNETQLIFEFESDTKQPLISVHSELVARMKPHQLDGTMFLWDNVYESLAQIRKESPGTGCILAHHMGL
jgi:transcriptional regulator ATRX